jgi:hypothetical protein
MTEQKETVNVDNIIYADMVKALAKPGLAIVASLTPETAHNLHMAIGVSGETGELLDSIEESIRTNVPFDMANIIEELGDIEFYMEGMYQGTGVTRDEVKQLLDTNAVFNITNMDVLKVATYLSIAAAALLDAIKKETIYCKPLDRNAVMVALARIEMQMDVMRSTLKIELKEILTFNKMKLGKRYASLSYSDAAAQARVDKAPGQ